MQIKSYYLRGLQVGIMHSPEIIHVYNVSTLYIFDLSIIAGDLAYHTIVCM